MPRYSPPALASESTSHALRDLFFDALLLTPLFVLLAWHLCAEWSRERFPVSGRVLLEGVPVERARVQLHSRGASRGPAVQGQTDASGRFEISTRYFGQGAAAGAYVVTIDRPALTFDGDNFVPGQNLLPPWYAQRGASNLRCNVQSVAENSVTFNLSYCPESSQAQASLASTN